VWLSSLLLLAACGDPSAPQVPAAQGPATTVPVDVDQPVDGCSPDNPPTEAVAAPGPAPQIAVRPESANSPLPDLAVRRINCAGGWINLRNEIPADRPVLAWFWAPY
jgi:hypothetical protein